MATIIGTSGSDTDLTGTIGSDKINAGAGDDTLIYNVTANVNFTRDVYTGGSGVDTVLLEMNYAQWIGYQSEISRYNNHLDTVKKNLNGEVSNGSSRDFTFVFGSSTLTVQMMEVLRVKVDVDGDGNFVEMNLANEEVKAVDDFASAEVDTPASIDVLNNDSVPDLVKSLAFTNPDLSELTLTYGTATLVKLVADDARTWYFKYSVGSLDADYIALGDGDEATDSFKYKVTDADGSEGMATVTITVTGANDLAMISDGTPDGVNDDFKGVVTEAGSVNEGGDFDATGKLTVVDPDNGESTFSEAVDVKSSKGYGTYSITESGEWTYKLDNDNEDVKALTTKGPTEEDTFTVSSLDGTATKTVTITIKGADDVVPLVAKEDVLWVTTNTLVTLSTAVLLKNDAGGDKSQLIVTNMADETGFTSLNLNAADGSFQFYSAIPNSSVVGPLPVTAEDDGLPGPGSGGVTVASPLPYTFTYTVKNTATGQSVDGSVTVNLLSVYQTDPNIWDLSGLTYDGAYLAGGGATDTFTAGNGDTVMVVGPTDVFVGGPGIDTVILLAVNGFYTLPPSVENLTVLVEIDTVTRDLEDILGNELENILIGSKDNMSIGGAGGDDILYGLGGIDFLRGDSGDDQLFGGEGGDYLFGWKGDDYLSGDSGDDQLFGDEGNDYLFDSSGNNKMTGGGGADSFSLSPASMNTVTDFSTVDGDKIIIDRQQFLLSSLSNFEFSSHASGTSAGTGKFFYNTETGQLFFGAVYGTVQIGLIGGSTHPNLISTDFTVW